MANWCHRRIQSSKRFDPRSFRIKRSGRAQVLVACPKGKFRRGRCKVGLQAVSVRVPAKNGRCPVRYKKG